MKTVIPSLYIRAIKKAMEKNNDPICEVFFFFKDNAQEKEHLKTQNSWINTLK